MMRKLKYVILLVVIIFLSWGIFKLEKLKKESEEKVNFLKSNLDRVEKENKELKEKIDYFSINENLLKEVKKQTNYRNEGEKMIIITPKEEINTSSIDTTSSVREN